VHRGANGKPALFPDDPDIVGLVTDVDGLGAELPTVHLDDIEAVAGLLQRSAIPLRDVAVAAAAAV
jgi:molybdopterin-guanine dinucleotide biosynthesis protein B